MKRPRRNTPERLFEEKMIADGWTVTKRGMPDFACYKDGKFILVEVKPSHDRNLARSQYKILSSLASFNVPCFRWTPDGNFTQILICNESNAIVPKG